MCVVMLRIGTVGKKLRIGAIYNAKQIVCLCVALQVFLNV